MNATELERERYGGINEAARQRILSQKGEPLFLADWKGAAFIHFEVNPKILQREVPFRLDLADGKAYVSVVAFDLENMRPRRGGRLAKLLMKPVGTHGFLNVRTYVGHKNETGIYFLAEYLPNKLSLKLGPLLYGLPYRFGKTDYDHRHENGKIFGTVSHKENSLRYRMDLPPACDFQPCKTNSLDEFLLERYSAFTFRNGMSRRFRIWHPPWPQVRAEVEISRTDLVSTTGEWFQHSRLSGAHYSPGFKNVWMSWPRCL